MSSAEMYKEEAGDTTQIDGITRSNLKNSKQVNKSTSMSGEGTSS